MKFAHSRKSYNKFKIKFREEKENESKSQKPSKVKKANHKRKPYNRVTRTVQVSPPMEYPKCGNNLKASRKQIQKIQSDLMFTKNGVRKSVTKYLLPHNYLPENYLIFIDVEEIIAYTYPINKQILP